MKRLVPFAAVLLICGALFAQTDSNVKKMPGYIDLEQIKIPDSAEEVTDISIGPSLLNLIAQSSDSSEAEGMKGIMSIRVKSFAIGEKADAGIKEQIEKILKKISDENWETLVKVKDSDEITNISIKTVKGKAVGLLILTYEPGDEVTLVNVCGNKIDLSSIKNMGMGFGDYGLDGIDIDLDF